MVSSPAHPCSKHVCLRSDLKLANRVFESSFPLRKHTIQPVSSHLLDDCPDQFVVDSTGASTRLHTIDLGGKLLPAVLKLATELCSTPLQRGHRLLLLRRLFCFSCCQPGQECTRGRMVFESVHSPRF